MVWIVWFISALFMCYKYALEMSPSIMAQDLMREFSLSGVEMGHLAATYFYAYLLMQIPAGLLIDRWGPRRVASIAMILCGGGAFIFSIADTFLLACIGRFTTGIGAAFSAINVLKIIANWFPSRQFAFMAGLTMTVGMLGAVLGQAPLAAFIKYLDWRASMTWIGVGGAVLGVLFFIIARDKSPHHPDVHLMPESPKVLSNLKKILSNPQAWYLSFYSGLAFAPVSAFGGLWGVPFLSEKFHFPHEDAVYGTSLIFLGFAFGAPFCGWLSDKIGKRVKPMFWGTLVAAICLATILYAPVLGEFFVMSILFIFGFSISVFLLSFSMIKEINSFLLAATSVGFMNAFDALFGAFSDPLTGKVLDLFWTGAEVDGVRFFSIHAYSVALLILIVYFILSFVFLRLIKETHCKQFYPSSLP